MARIQPFQITDALIERIAEYVMLRRQEYEPDDTPCWADFVADPNNAELVAKWRMQTRAALEAIQLFAEKKE